MLSTPGGGGYGNSEQNVTGKCLKTNGDHIKTYVERGSVFEYRSAQEGV